MKISNYFFLFILLSTSLIINGQSNNSAKKPQAKQKGVHMTFDHEKISLGKVKKGEIRKFEYVFTNTGTDIIEIDIASGCDCTTLDYPTNKILPGKKAIVKVSFDSGKKEGNETSTDVDVYLKNINPKTGQRILKILNFTYEIEH
ncbi:MAG: DUF1573 domain-containing protein [Saprospiraceae bacterium]|jgi:hypothetical protein|nr:DUF1573 domain-containing protein [Saprospiraceae bacterium]MBL0025386.1 DUF1573 domain-containing protein [Saprospiraceae bacterium]